MINIFLPFLISLIFLVISANFLVKSTEKLAAKIKLSPLVIGATLIAIGTSLPETSVAVSSLIQKVPAISMGDIIGSNIGNIGLILGLAILVFPIRVGTEKTQRNSYILLVATVLFSVLLFLPSALTKNLSLILVAFYSLFIVSEIAWGETGSKHEDKRAISKMAKVRGRPFLFLAGILLSLSGLIFASKYLVSSVIQIATIFKVEAEIIGLTLVAIGTSLPELVTIVVSGLKKDWKLIYGNIQGSNIYNLSVIGAILLYFGSGADYLHKPSVYYLVGISLALFFLTKRYKGRTIPRLWGLAFLFAYGLYLKLIYGF